MNWLAPTVLFGWIPTILVMFLVMPARRVVLLAYFGAWLFLPNLEYSTIGLPNISKISVTTYSVMLGMFLFDSGRFINLRLNWWDMPMLVWCFVPLPSAIANGYGPYEGVSGVVSNLILWGFPYLVGRLYFSTTEGARDLLVAFVVGGLVYLPLILYEAKMSPVLHYDIYGFQAQHDFSTTRRMGGWRPQVFMQHGLAVALYMTIAGVSALGLWLWSGVGTVLRLSVSFCVGILFFGSMLCRSAYAIALMFLAGAVLAFARFKPSHRVVVLLGLLPIAYVSLRTMGAWDGSVLVDLSTRFFGPARTASLVYRMESESNLWAVAQTRPIFGYGRWIWPNRLPNGGVMVPDGLWIIALGRNGLVGLGAVTLMLVLPGWRLVYRLRRFDARAMGVGVWLTLAVSPAIYAMDNLLNAMVNPLFMLAAGAVAGFAVPVVGRRLAPVAPASSMPERPPGPHGPEAPA